MSRRPPMPRRQEIGSSADSDDSDFDPDSSRYYSADESEIESDEELNRNRREIKTRKALKAWFKTYVDDEDLPDGTVEAVQEEVKELLDEKYKERQLGIASESESEEAGFVQDDSYCYQISESSDAEDPREGADMGRDFYWNPSDDSSADEMEGDQLRQIDPDDPVVDQASFQPDPVWNSTMDPQVGLWGTNHPHAPFPGSTLKWHSIVWDDGTTYEGLSRENIPHAYGTLVMGNAYAGNLVEPNVGRGTRYEGMFRAGAVEGLGQMSWPSGKVYKGEWVQGQKHGCGAMYDFSPMLRLVREGKTPAEAWEESKDGILGNTTRGTWNRDKFVSDPADEVAAGKPGAVTTRKIDPQDLCDNAIIDGVLEELGSVVQRARMFQHKPDGEVAIRFLQDGRGTPAPVMQDPIYYPHGTKWMAPGPVGQAYALPEDEKLKKHLGKVADNYYKIYRMYNFPWLEDGEKPALGTDLQKAQSYWPEEYFQEGPNSSWWYNNVLYPQERKIEEDIKWHTDKDYSEYRKDGRDSLRRNWVERGKDLVDSFFEKQGWKAAGGKQGAGSKADEQYGMLKDFIKDCDEVGFISSWKLLDKIESSMEERRNEVGKVNADRKAKGLKRKELSYRLERFQSGFDALAPRKRSEEGMALVQDITDFGFLKEFVKSGDLELRNPSDADTVDHKIAVFTKLKGKDWDKEPPKSAPKRMVNPIIDPIDLTKLSPEDKERWKSVLDYLYNELPEDSDTMRTLLTQEQQDFVDFYKKKYGKAHGDAGGAGRGRAPANLASLSVGLTRFSFAVNQSMSFYAKRAFRRRRFGRR